MKIAHFTDTYLPYVNGASYSIEATARLLSKSHTVRIYAPAYKNGRKKETVGKVQVERYPSFPLPTYKDVHVVSPVFQEVLDSVKEFDPDIIHFHTPSMMGLAGILAAKRLHTPLVGTYHNFFSENLIYVSLEKLMMKLLEGIDTRVSEWGIDMAWMRKWRMTGEKHHTRETVLQTLTWKMVNKIYSYCDAVICPSETVQKELVKRGFGKSLKVISNGLDLRQFPPKTVKTPSLVILHVGRLDYSKHIEVLLEAMVEVKGTLPGAVLWIAGSGPEEKRLKKIARDLGVSRVVRFLGHVSREKLSVLYRKAGVFAIASTMETQGIVLLEAMASGLPIVGVKKYAIPDAVKNGKNGYVVPAFQSREMAKKLLYLLTNPDIAATMGMAGRKMAQAHEVGKMAEKTEKLYQELIRKSAKITRENGQK